MRILTTLLMGLLLFSLAAQENFNIELVAHVPNDESLSDVWGFVAEDGTEYAIIGTNSSTEVYSLQDPSSPNLVAKVPGASSIWRDMKTLGNYIYVTTDRGEDGITIIDMSEAPENITSSKVNPIVNGDAINTCHNLYIDTSLQIMFLAGCNNNQGVLAFDITTDPLMPELIKIVSETYAHDVFVRDNKVFASEIFDRQFVIYDIEDLMNVERLGSASTTNLFTHNAWSSEDNQYVFTTDEVPNGTVDAYDISDLNNPVKVDVFQPESIKDKGIIVHNTHWIDNYLVTSWYKYGIVISDVSNPEKIVEVGHYDTGENPDCWGAYPYLPSGLILASDIPNGFYVLQPTYTRAAFLKGIVSSKESGNPIFNARIKVLAPNQFSDRTNPKGEYTTGDLQEGTFQVIVSHPEYVPDTSEVIFTRGETQEVNFTLEKEAIYTQTIKTVEKLTGNPIGNVQVLLSKEDLDVNVTTNENGEISDNFVGGAYTVIVGAWGYQYGVIETQLNSDGIITVELDRGFQDDFIFDYGWTNEAPNERSRWVREIPNGTSFGDDQSNPFADVEDDLGDFCYITGNDIGGVGAFDVDDGTSILISPAMDLSSFPNATLQFRPWFYNNGGGGGAPNDSYKIYATNGIDRELIVDINESTGGWADMITVKLADFITLNDQVKITFEASDDAEDGHLVEAGLDQFAVLLDGVVSVGETAFEEEWDLFPNPATTLLTLSNEAFSGQVNVAIYNTTGMLVSTNTFVGGNIQLDAPGIPGIYYLKITTEDGCSESKRVTIIDR